MIIFSIEGQTLFFFFFFSFFLTLVFDVTVNILVGTRKKLMLPLISLSELGRSWKCPFCGNDKFQHRRCTWSHVENVGKHFYNHSLEFLFLCQWRHYFLLLLLFSDTWRKWLVVISIFLFQWLLLLPWIPLLNCLATQLMSVFPRC